MFFPSQDQQRTQDQSEGCKKIENYLYRASDKIGQGNFSQVYKGIDRETGCQVAIKVIKYSSITSKVSQQLLKNQVSILRGLKHPNVIRCIDIFTSSNNCYIITQFCEGGDIQRLLSRHKYFQQKDIGKMVYQIYKGLAYLNQQNIIHRDFKIANVFLTANGVPRIADFGFAVKTSQPFKDINIGSPIYMSPQGMLLHEYGPKTDVWAFGIMIYQLLHGQTPLSGCKNDKQLKQKVLVQPNFRHGISSDLRYLIDRCLAVDPKLRISMKEIAQTNYMSKLIHEFQGIKRQKQLTSTGYTSTVQGNLLNFIKDIKTYDEGLAVLQYCRLIHKTAQLSPSPLLSQWLLNICWYLQKSKPTQGNSQKIQKLQSTIKDYYIKYKKQHHDSHANISPDQVIIECDNLNNRNSFNLSRNIHSLQNNNLLVLKQETDLLKKYVEIGNFSGYVKATQVQKYLDSIKKKQVPVSGFGLYQMK